MTPCKGCGGKGGGKEECGRCCGDGVEPLIIIPGPEYIGQYEMRKDVEVIPADDSEGKKIGWMMYTYHGCEVFGDADHTIRLTNYADIYPGREVYLSWNEDDRTPCIVDDNKNISTEYTTFILEFDKDDRHCWSNASIINTRGLRGLVLNDD